SELSGVEANLRRRVLCGCDYEVDLLAGFRHLDLREGLQIQEDVISLRAVDNLALFQPGTESLTTDIFNTHNQFYGGQVGANGRLHRGRWVLDLTGKLA